MVCRGVEEDGKLDSLLAKSAARPRSLGAHGTWNPGFPIQDRAFERHADALRRTRLQAKRPVLLSPIGVGPIPSDPRLAVAAGDREGTRCAREEKRALALTGTSALRVQLSRNARRGRPGEDLDHAADRVGTVEGGERTASDLDALDVLRRGQRREVVSGEIRRVDAHAVHENQRLRRVGAAQEDRRQGPVAPLARHALSRRPRRTRAPSRGTSGRPSSRPRAARACPRRVPGRRPRRSTGTSRPGCPCAAAGRGWSRPPVGSRPPSLLFAAWNSDSTERPRSSPGRRRASASPSPRRSRRTAPG